ncbi:SH3-like domain-containing protein [Pelagibius sp.]|uniref:SH3-like domain-containing protein n=1 Tax=Pelagibius sp. TaxID=1931238 RepID=UPI003B505903
MTARFDIGARVAVRAAYPPGHVRTPFFIRGKTGVVTEILGPYRNPEALAYGRSGDPALPLYRVLFRTSEIWDEYDGPTADTTVVDIYENWLDPAET